MRSIILTLLMIIPCLIAQAPFPYYNDQKENCSKSVTNNFCYHGPMFDAVGQYKSCSVPGMISITFDDGPSQYTSHILDVLMEYNMKATFFVIGKQLRTYHTLIQRMINEGHQLGSHTHGHVDLTTSTDPYQEMVNFEIDLVKENFDGPLSNHYIPSYMRAPHGALNIATFDVVQNQLGYLPIHWGILTQDSNGIPSTEVLPRYFTRLGGDEGDGVNAMDLTLITQQHDVQQATAVSFSDLALYLNQTFGSQGVRFVTVAECLGNTVPAYRPNPRMQNDPTCASGIKQVSVGACCLASCGRCGGTGCSSRPGGAEGCCTNNIITANYSCTLSPAPCVYTI